jgi:hypothetical protein
MIAVGIFLVFAVLAVGLLFLRLHTLPERIAHRTHKLQFEIVAVLGLLALFTHMHIFWVAGLLLALVDLPDLGNPLRRMAGSLETMAGLKPGQGAVDPEEETLAGRPETERPVPAPPVVVVRDGEPELADAKRPRPGEKELIRA